MSKDLETERLRVPDSGVITCNRCEAEIERLERVAMFTRTWPGDPLDAWCVECAHLLVYWAKIGSEVSA